MHIVVLGAGALGGLFGAHLTEAGHDVSLLEANAARARLLTTDGLYLAEGDRGERHVRLKVVTSVAGLAPADLLFVAVKTYQTEAAVRAALPVVTERTWILTTQNGVGNVERIRKVFDTPRILTGITFHSIQHTGPNRLRYRGGIKPIQMSPADGRITDEVRAIGEVFSAAGLEAEVVPGVDEVIWQKLAHNAVINPMSALTGMTCSELLEDEDVQAFMRALALEIAAVMKARGMTLEDDDDPYAPIIRSQQALAKNYPSMWQDLARGFPTEVDAINGGVVDEARRLGIEVPLHWAIVRFIHSRERRQQRGRQRDAAARGEAGTEPAPLRRTPRSGRDAPQAGLVEFGCAAELGEIVHGYYRDLAAADRAADRHVAWCSGLGPVEIVRAMGYTPYFPEHHAALVGMGRLHGKCIGRALAAGFSPFSSSEAASDVGAVLAGESPLAALYGIDSLPRPEVLVYSTNAGAYVARWFEYHAHRARVPMLGVHPPPALGELDAVDVDAAVRQTLRLVERLERHSGRRLDHDRLAETVERSAQASRLWKEILDLARSAPSPLTSFDALLHMAPMLLMRGTAEAVRYYETLLAEVRQRVAGGIAAVPGERSRFYWEGPPAWCALGPLAGVFHEHGVAVVGATATAAAALDGLDRDNPIESLAAAGLAIYPNRSREHKLRFLAGEFARYEVDAAVFHDARTSPEHSGVRHGLHLSLEQDTGIPALVIEGDTHDLRLVSVERIRSQLGELLALRSATAGAGGRA